jgi:ABC-type lipoprotein release transport system permease subunit
VAVGVAAGLAVALAAARFLAPFLYGGSPTDAQSYASAVLLLAAVSVAASIVPARRVARVEPASVLRVE